MDLLNRVPHSQGWRLTAILFLCMIGGIASTQTPTEFAVKGAYLSRFGEYVDWPAKAFQDARSPFVIGILGEDPFAGQLDQVVQNRSILGHPVVIRRIKRLDQAERIHVLYVGEREAKNWNRIRETLRGRNILTVGEKGAGADVVISFVILQNKVRFEIDVDAAERADLKFSSKLLGLALVLKRDPERG